MNKHIVENYRKKIIEMIYELEVVKADNIAYDKSYEEQEKRIEALNYVLSIMN